MQQARHSRLDPLDFAGFTSFTNSLRWLNHLAAFEGDDDVV
jgi:hypothetical protein